MKTWNLTAMSAITVAVAAAFPGSAFAQSNEDLLKEIRALRERVTQLEAKQAAKPAAGQWGMTPEQAADLARVTTKTEGLEDSLATQGLNSLKISGFFDPTFIYNKAQDRAGFQHVSPVSANPYAYDNGYFGTAALDIQKELEGGTKWHFTIMPNRGAGSIADGTSIVHEASVSIPLGSLQTRLIAGQIPDWSGYEYTQPNTTKLVTRGLLLDFTEPTMYTGAGMELVRGSWDMKMVLANFNRTMQPSGTKSPVIAYRADYAKGEYSGFGFAGVHGKVANFTSNVLDTTGAVVAQPDSHLDLFEADGYFIRGDLTLQGQVGFGRQKYASITPAADGSLRDASWWGISGLAAYKFIPRWEAVARLDYINNSKNGGGLLGYTSADGRNGIGYGMTFDSATSAWIPGDIEKGANRYALALGVNYLLTPNTLIKVEYRLDRASQPVFVDVRDGSYSKSNQLFGTAVVVSF